MKILNISNQGKQIYLFSRDEQGKQSVHPVDNFYPYFYQEDINGTFKTFDGKKVKQIICKNPKEISP